MGRRFRLGRWTWPVGVGRDCRVQAAPFHFSATIEPFPPTAQQRFVVGQDTAARAAVPGMVWMVQVEVVVDPFQLSANGSETPWYPTATQFAVVGQDTFNRALVFAAARTGRFVWDQVEPFSVQPIGTSAPDW
jgi:hypothetical protein